MHCNIENNIELMRMFPRAQAKQRTQQIYIRKHTNLYVIGEFELQQAFGMYIFDIESTLVWILYKHIFRGDFKVFPIF